MWQDWWEAHGPKGMTVPIFIEKVRALVGGGIFSEVCRMAKAGRMSFGTNPTVWGMDDGRGNLPACIAWARGHTWKFVLHPDPGEDHEERKRLQDGPYKAFDELAALFGPGDTGRIAYSCWAWDNRTEIVKKLRAIS